jgi:hypothetical protein
VSCLLVLSGCGEKSSPPTEAPRDLSGTIGQNGSTPDGETPAPPEQPATEPQQPGATDFAPVDIELRDGGFAKRTPRTIHVPSGFIVVVHATADDSGPYVLRVLSPSVAQSFKIKPGGEQRVTLDSMRQGQIAKLMVAGKTVKVAADADPGP